MTNEGLCIMKFKFSYHACIFLYVFVFMSSVVFAFPLNIPDPRAARSGNLLYVEKGSEITADIEGETNKVFFIISKEVIKKVGIYTFNGNKTGTYTIKCGREQITVNLLPNQKKVVLLNLKKTFSNVNYFYEVSVCVPEGRKLAVKFICTRYAAAIASLENKQYKLAKSILQELLKENPALIEPRLYLGAAYEKSRLHREAAKIFRETISSYPGLFESYIALCRSAAADAGDEETFRDLFYRITGTTPGEIRERYHFRLIPWDLNLGVGKYVKGGAIYRTGQERPGDMLYGPYMRFPEGAYTVRYTISSPGGLSCSKPVVGIDVLSYPKKLAQKHINGNEINDYPKKFSLHFYNNDPWKKLEFRVTPNGKANILAGDIDIFCNIRESLNRNYLTITRSMRKSGISINPPLSEFPPSRE